MSGAQNDEELVKILLRRYKILKELYLGKEYTLTELNDRLKIDLGNLSRYITELEKNGLIETEEVLREGRPFRYIRPSSKTAQIISSIIDATKPVPETRYEPQAIDLCLDVIEDEGLDEVTRKCYAESLDNRFRSMPVRILREHDRLEKFLEAVVVGPPTDDEIGERKRSMISLSLPRLIREESTRSWVMNSVYPNMLKILGDKTNLGDKNKPEFVVSWAVSMLESIGMGSPNREVSEEIGTKLREAYFDEALNPDSKVAEKLQNAILQLFCREPKSARELANYLRTRAKNNKDVERKKAILLLKRIADHLPT